MIHINNLHKRFGDSHVLRGISCDIKPQEVVCIIGPSGSGKSTFLRCMNALETVSEGEVVVNGFAAHDRTTDLNKMRESVGMVFQRFNLFPHMTVLENLIMAPMNLRNMPRPQAVDLVFHQGDQGRHDDAQPLLRKPGDLVGKRLSAARGHQGQGVAPVHHRTDDTLLYGAEFGEAPVAFQYVVYLVRWPFHEYKGRKN